MEISSTHEIVAYLRDKKGFLFDKYGVTRMGIFGSFMHGKQTITSDIDMVVEFDKSKKNSNYSAKKPKSSKKSLDRVFL